MDAVLLGAAICAIIGNLAAVALAIHHIRVARREKARADFLEKTRKELVSELHAVARKIRTTAANASVAKSEGEDAYGQISRVIKCLPAHPQVRDDG